MRTLPRAILLLTLLFAISIRLLGQSDYLDYRGELRSWPVAARPELKVQTQSISDGENTLSSFVLSGAGLRLIMPIEDGMLQRPPTARYSASFSHRVVPDFVLGISVFNSGTFIKEPSAEEILGYLKALLIRVQKGTTIKILHGPLDDAPKADFPVLGSFPLYVVYEVSDENTGQSFRRAEYFAQVNDQLVVVVYQNRVDAFDRMQGFVMPIIARIYPQ
ncbi:MAG: hypothetical protein SFY80_02405 [Verrucomicrobiota bacterium]|nr:hypothetical protein [Verrucomicrobiota bacterium]